MHLRKHMGEASGDYVDWMVDYICEHREPVNLLLCRAEGTSYEHFVHNMVEVEVEYTLKYMEVLRRLGKDIPQLDQSLCHIIASGMFNGLFEIAGFQLGLGIARELEPYSFEDEEENRATERVKMRYSHIKN